MSFYQSPPFFDGDDWHELRDAQIAQYRGTLRAFAACIETLYTNCWVVAGCPLDTVRHAFMQKKRAVLRPLRATHDLFAAYWRKHNGFTQPPLPGIEPHVGILVERWQRWFYEQPLHWLRLEPAILRALLEMTSGWRDDVTGDVIRSWELPFSLRELYDFDSLAGEESGLGPPE